MKRFFSLMLALVMSLALLLPAMSVTAFAYTDVEVEDEDYYKKFYGQGLKVYVYNWGEYISDGSDDSLDINKAFEELTGVEVVYSTFASNEELYAKLRSGSVSYDVVIPSDYMIGRMRTEGLLQKINFDNVPNYRYIDENYKSMVYDPDNEYSVPYTWGTVGIIYNKNMVDENDVKSWNIFWDARYLGEMLMFDNSRDAFAISLKRLGYSYNTTDEDELREAAEELKKQKPLIQGYVMDEIFDKMLGEEAALAPYYAGDAITMIEDNPNLGYAVPEEGTNLFVDAMCIPAASKNPELAEMYINFMCETEVAAANCEFIGYSTPHTEALSILDPEISENEIAYPPQEVLDKAEAFLSLPSETNKLLDLLWTEVKSENTNTNPWIVPVILVLMLLASIAINVIRRIRNKKKIY